MSPQPTCCHDTTFLQQDKIAPNDNNVTDTVEEILADAASKSIPPLVVFIVYDVNPSEPLVR